MDSGSRSPAVAVRRLSFGSVARQYDQVRPHYPEKLVDRVLSYAGVTPASRALEIGAGTGQATLQFAWRGLQLHALEPSPEMAAIGQQRLQDSGLKVTFDVVDFESARLAPASFDLVFAATSWHWLEPGRRWDIVADALRPGGSVAVFWHWPLWRHSSQRAALDEVYRRSGIDLTQMGPMLDVTPDVTVLAREWLQDAREQVAFSDVRGATYNWTDSLAGDQYAALLGTYADHLALDADLRDSLLAAVSDVITTTGGRIDLPYCTTLLMARINGSVVTESR
jgi:SAM-dependent methyltransferase